MGAANGASEGCHSCVSSESDWPEERDAHVRGTRRSLIAIARRVSCADQSPLSPAASELSRSGLTSSVLCPFSSVTLSPTRTARVVPLPQTTRVAILAIREKCDTSSGGERRSPSAQLMSEHVTLTCLVAELNAEHCPLSRMPISSRWQCGRRGASGWSTLCLRTPSRTNCLVLVYSYTRTYKDYSTLQYFVHSMSDSARGCHAYFKL